MNPDFKFLLKHLHEHAVLLHLSLLSKSRGSLSAEVRQAINQKLFAFPNFGKTDITLFKEPQNEMGRELGNVVESQNVEHFRYVLDGNG